jgi:beta-galactosidase
MNDHASAQGGADVAIPTHHKVRYVRLLILGATRRGGSTCWASVRNIGIHYEFGSGRLSVWTPPDPKPENPAQRDSFAATGLNDNAWASIPVPWNWEMAGFSKPTYDNPDDAVGLYRRKVDIPASFAGKTVIWHFEGVWDSAEIFINGKRAGYHESGFTAFDMDVTKFVQAGKRNLLAVRVCKNTPSDDLDTGDYWSLGGIYRDTYLIAVNPSHIRNIKVVTHLDSQNTNATLGISVGETQAAPGEMKLHAELFHADGTRVAGVAMDDQTDVQRAEGGVMQLRAEVPKPLLWSAEKPNLYYAVLTLSVAGKVVERVQERFGFREIQIKNGVVLWNGTPIKCTGTCRHEEWAALGHALNENAWRTDLKLMKGCNINAVRTSHYNHAGRFLELCDEVGIYVLDEVPACWCNLSDPTLKYAFVQRTRETLDRDQNKPCVLAWSLANESGYGPNAAAMLQYVKANDPTRPAFVSQCGPWNNPLIDFVDTHYPSIEEVKRLASDPMRKTTPVVMTEQPHIFYVRDGLTYDYGEKDYWGQVLASNWSVVWPTDSILGSFIWEWQDQGIADKFPDSGRDSSGLRDNNNKGIVDGYRNVKPEYWNIKMVYSPVTTEARETAIANARDQLRNDTYCLPSTLQNHCQLPCKYRYGYAANRVHTSRWPQRLLSTSAHSGRPAFAGSAAER